jgi:hypothetical protein
MSIGPISASGLSQSILASSDSNQLQQTLQTLQKALDAGDLTGAQSAFQGLSQLSQQLETASGSTSSSNSQFSTDLAALGTALNSGDLTTAQSAFATVQKDLKSHSSPSIAAEINTASQSLQMVQSVLSTLDSSGNSSSTSEAMNSVLQSIYGSNGGLNVLA